MNELLQARASNTPWLSRALDYLHGCYETGHADKTIVVGCTGADGVALAAGLSSPGEHRHLVLLAQYLFAKQGVQHYLLAMPAWAGDQPVLVLEFAAPGGREHWLSRVRRGADGVYAGLSEATPYTVDGPLVADLLARGQSLPGIMRRELDSAYQRLRINAGEFCSGVQG